jgi:anti-sigma factor RsiW
MKCSQIQDLILTDYLDGRLEGAPKDRLEAHLSTCTGCREFEETARKTVFEPFSMAEKPAPAETVWHRIKKEIEAEQPAVSRPLTGLARTIRSFFSARKPALALATAMTVLLVSVMILRTPPEKPERAGINIEEEISYVGYLLEGSNQFSANGNGGLGTSIEEYFL